jgi:carbon storage regulator
MLVLSRRLGEEVVIGRTIRVTIIGAKGDRVRIGVAAPPSVTVYRQEVHDRRSEQANEPAGGESKHPPGQGPTRPRPGASPHP